MTRLQTVRAGALRVLFAAQCAFTAVYLAAGLIIDPSRALAGTLILAAVTALAGLSWRAAPDVWTTRAVFAAAMMAFPAALTFLMSGQAWQIDMHMTFFAALAAVTVLVDWRALIAAAATAAIHHLVLNFALPAAVFPDGGDLWRVVFHAVVVIAQTALLIWLARGVARALGEADAALSQSEAARAEAAALLEADRTRQSEIDRSRQTIASVSSAFEQSVTAVLRDLQAASGELGGLACQLRADAGATRASAEGAAGQARDTSAHVEAVASAAQELAASIAEVTRTLGAADEISMRAETEAGRAGSSMDDLHNAAREIEDIAELVSAIAEQTNLLALNATIEAARAGEAGRGFAVVASEVKQLAVQTARATGDIRSKIEAMRKAAESANGALTGIARTICDIRQASSSARNAFSEQSCATDEIARLASDAASSTARVGEEAGAVTGAAARADEAAARFEMAAQGLASAANRLGEELAAFRSRLADAA
ncbi:MAG: chemotaxis protein [Alphaproteobacteria bacterium]|nr:chemotaxis protein [Alphaproteobacteria bacterium]